MFIDTHCHVLKCEYDDIKSVIDEMKDNLMIVSGYDRESNKEVLELVDNYPNIYGTIGIHPSEADTYLESDLEFIEENINNSKIVGIGEIGLDYHFIKDNKEKQKELFIKQLDIAKKYNKSVVIHSRDAMKDTMEIIKNYDLKMDMHCYSGSLETANELIKMNVKLGIGGVLTFNNSEKLKEIVKNIDLSNILLETDSPYLTPVPYRGKKNKPSYVHYVALKIAELKNISVDEVINVTTNNAINQFDLKV